VRAGPRPADRHRHGCDSGRFGARHRGDFAWPPGLQARHWRTANSGFGFRRLIRCAARPAPPPGLTTAEWRSTRAAPAPQVGREAGPRAAQQKSEAARMRQPRLPSGRTSPTSPYGIRVAKGTPPRGARRTGSTLCRRRTARKFVALSRTGRTSQTGRRSPTENAGGSSRPTPHTRSGDPDTDGPSSAPSPGPPPVAPAGRFRPAVDQAVDRSALAALETPIGHEQIRAVATLVV
jgi:hypothetical protein